MCVFPNAFILPPHLLVVNLLLVSCYNLHNGCYCNEGRLLVGVDDLDFKVRDVAFEAKVLNMYDTFDQIVNRTMEDPSYTHLHYDLLDKVALTMVTLRVKSPHIQMNEQFLQKGIYLRVENFGICKQGFEKGDMHIVITIESTTIVSSISSFQFQCFFTQIQLGNLQIMSKVGIPIVLQFYH
jgi:hypothetical protein